jgi:hypothetical protein
MSFDISRFTFNPWKDYLGVVMQQGRVQLDSDWNEWLAEYSRRIQAGTLDILGLTGVPSTTPYGFKIKAYSSGQQITIGTGRIYVDGLLVENHGSFAEAQWDSALAEWSGAPPGAGETDVPGYTNQPFLPGATVPGNGPFLVYLDVWLREATYVEDVHLVDKAVGVDTTGRLQTVWQVKLLDISGITGITGGVNCWTPNSTIEQTTIWGYLLQPSPGLLTNGLVQLAPSGPCALNPATGYTGLENQLYRVEIHQGGGPAASVSYPLPPGTATFKWSRENASVATTVTNISTVTNSVGATASQLTVQSIGRDQVLGFNPGNWIEIIDDYLELNPPVINGQPQTGELHKIDSINPAANTVTLDSPVSSVSFPVNSSNQTDPSRHTRIRRWDQAGTVYLSDGATVWVDLDSVGNGGIAGTTGIPVPPAGTALILENGITVAFDLAPSGSSINAWNSTTTYSGNAPASVVAYLGAGWIAVAPVTGTAPGVVSGQWEQLGFRAGDFWSFAARTADGSVENLTKASPLGIQHHYCRLGIVNFTATPATFSDSRPIFPALANPCIRITNILVGGTTLQNDSPITVQELAGGISIICDAPLSQSLVSSPAAQSSNCPFCFVTVDLPIPTSPPSGGFNPFILAATVSVGSAGSGTITWTPTAAAQAALLNNVAPGGLPLLARLTLKGNFVSAQGNSRVYLNGAILGLSGGQGTTSLQLPSGDGRRSGDLEMWFWLTSQPAVSLSTNAINFFTAQPVGSTSSPQTVTLTNNGKTTLTFPGTGISVTGTNPGDFKATNTCGTVVAPNGASCTITVTFTPAAAGTRTASISIQESADPNPLLITLTGTGIQPLVNASVSSLVFAAQTVGITSAPQTVTLTNPGSSQLSISAISLEGETTDFALTNLCGTSLQPNQGCTISVEFEQTAAGTRSATLQILTNASNVAGGTLLISLSGTGLAAAPGISVSPTSWNFGSVLTISSSAKAFTLTSTGNTALTIALMTITGTNAGSFTQTNSCGGSLQPGQQCTINVVFKPTGVGSQTALLEIFHNAAGSPLIITLTGTGEVKGKDTKETKDIKEVEKGALLEKAKDTLPKVETSSSPDISAQATSASGTQTAFITPQERPSVGPQA